MVAKIKTTYGGGGGGDSMCKALNSILGITHTKQNKTLKKMRG